MIIQEVLKGIHGITSADVQAMFDLGIQCNWWRKVGSLPANEIPIRLNDRNLDWHQNHYDDPDPLEGGETFSVHTPFISTTAGTVQRDVDNQTNLLTPAWMSALYFATDFLRGDGYIFYCNAWILGRPAVAHQAFAEELREMNIYTGFSTYQPEGEITAKIFIPPAQIQRAEFWSLSAASSALATQVLPTASSTMWNTHHYVDPSSYNNVRAALV